MNHPEKAVLIQPPKTWILESFLVMIFLFFPVGLVAVIFSLQVMPKFNNGNYDSSIRMSKRAGLWTKIGFFIGLPLLILSIVTAILHADEIF